MVEWSGRKVLVIGAARQGVALARYLSKQSAEVTLTDQKTSEKLADATAALADLPIRWALGEHPFSLLDDCDLVCPSGGVPLDLPLVAEARRRGIQLSNDSQIFLEVAPCKVIGITGSAGKTTTTTLVWRMANAAHGNPGLEAGRKVFLGGNIGAPLISVVDEMTPGDLAVMELSSFQLEIMTCSPQVAAILNITPNHLDRHGTMEAYTAAKARILEFQSPSDTAVLGREDPGAWSLAGRVRGRLFSFRITPPGEISSLPAGGKAATEVCTYFRDGSLYMWDGQAETELMPRTMIRLRGEHNLLNVLAACAISAAAGLPAEAMQAGVDGFNGVAHRLEFIRHWGGADWYNDSIATAPERVMADIRSFDEQLVLLVGGRDKHLPWDEFAALARQRVAHLVLFGEMADLVEKALISAGKGSYSLIKCGGLREAVQAAARIVTSGKPAPFSGAVLLSPGGTSFDEFRDFEERGDAFRKLVSEL
jgi:UDP-N-acetylmuramoylalanine--D-glutamate ligase